MFNRFTSRALRVLFYARFEVSQLGSSALEPEHILLGVLDADKELGSRILAEGGGTIDDFRSGIVGRFTSHPKIPKADEIPFSASSQRVLQYAAEEADGLNHVSISPEHLLLGLLREEGCVAADVLAERGVRIEAVREALGGEQPDVPGPPWTPASTYQWPQIPFVPSRTVHILYSGMQSPEPPTINHAGPVFSAYGFTLKDIIVRAWEGSRWHVEIPPGLDDGTRFDFLMVLPQEESTATCLGVLQRAIEQHFSVAVTRESRMRDVYVMRKRDVPGKMLRRYPDPEAGFSFSLLPFSTFAGRSPDAPMFPLDPFTVHSVPFFVLANWFEEILGGQVINEAELPGIYGFELKLRVNTPEAFIGLLGDEAGLTVTRYRREIPTLVVSRR